MRRTTFAMLALGLAGCASYRPAPLGTGTAAFGAPAQSVLMQETTAIARPYLKPVPVDLSGPLDLNAVALVTVVSNPDLRAQRSRAGVADAQVFDARLLPDPTLSFGADLILSGPDPFSNLVASIGQELNALRTRHARVEGAQAAARQVRLDLAWAEWQTAGQARIQAVRIRSLARLVDIAEKRDSSAHDLVARMLRAAQRGDLAGDQVQAARIGAIDSAELLREAQKESLVAHFELNRLMGLPPEAVLDLADSTLPPPPPPADRLFQIAQAQRLDLQALRAGYETQESAVHLAVLEQFPTLNLAISANRDTGGNRLLGGAVDFTLPAWNRNRGKIAVETATRAALKAEFEARMFQTRAEIAAAVAGIEAAWQQRAQLQADLPGLHRFADASERAAARGDIALSAYQAARDTVRDRELLLVQVERAVAEQTIALELLTGVPQGDWTR